MSEPVADNADCCYICNHEGEERIPFLVSCSTPNDPGFAVRGQCCGRCGARVRKKELLAPVGALGLGLLIAPLVALAASGRFMEVVLGEPNLWVIVPMCVGSAMIVIYAISCWVVGRTDFQEQSFKKFITRTAKRRLDTYTPTMQLKTSAPRGLTLVEYDFGSSDANGGNGQR